METIEFLKLLIPVIAITISIISLSRTNFNNRRQIRSNKLEELMECLQFYTYQYRSLYQIYELQKVFKLSSESTSDIEKENAQKKCKYAIEEFKKRMTIEKMQTINSRLTVLSNSYLPDKETKWKIASVVVMMTNLVNSTLLNKFEDSQILFAKYPNSFDFIIYIDKLNSEILKEMRLGYKNPKIENLFKYTNTFKKDLKIN